MGDQTGQEADQHTYNFTAHFKLNFMKVVDCFARPLPHKVFITDKECLMIWNILISLTF